MPKFNVHIAEVVSTSVTVDTETAEEATENFGDADDMPGSMGYGAFGQNSVDEAGEWIPVSVTDETGNEVWTDPNPFGHPVSIAALAIDAAYSDDNANLHNILKALSTEQLHALAGAASHLGNYAARLAPKRAAEETRSKES